MKKAKAPELSLEEQVQWVLEWLRAHSTKATRDGMSRYAIPSDKALGVAMKDMKALGKKLGHNHELALALWETGWYEARMLTSFVADPSALERRDQIIAVWDRFFSDFDALIVPPAMTTAFPHCASGSPLLVDGKHAEYFGQGALLAMANVAGLPALVAPAGQDEDGLPIGVQIVGPRWSEMSLLNIARALESAQILPGFRPPPPLR